MHAISLRCCLTIFLAAAICGCTGCGPNSDDSKLREVERLEGTIPVLPSLVEIRQDRTSKGIVASISKYYTSEVRYNEVKRFYGNELRKHGWEYVGEKQLKEWGKDFGGCEIKFSNKEYYFSIQYAGEKAPYDWNYVISLGWRE